MRNTFVLFCLAAALMANAQRVLHFTATSGYDHGTRDVSFAMFTSIGNELGIDVVNDATGTTFSDASVLAEFDAIIFSNTSGNDILDATQRANFEQWVANGGHVLGIHAASDTYRHSTANGNNTGTWDFFPELIGASVQENPNHVSGTPLYAIEHVGTHDSTADLPDPWQKNEEYYYWEDGYFGTDNDVVLAVEATIGPNGHMNSYDAPRPMSWYRELSIGSRIFYTALGHATSNYTDDFIFREHLKDALAWLLSAPIGIEEGGLPTMLIYPNPATDQLHVRTSPALHKTTIFLIDVSGRIVHRESVHPGLFTFSITELDAGIYTIIVSDGTYSQTMIIQ